MPQKRVVMGKKKKMKKQMETDEKAIWNDEQKSTHTHIRFVQAHTVISSSLFTIHMRVFLRSSLTYAFGLFLISLFSLSLFSVRDHALAVFD